MTDTTAADLAHLRSLVKELFRYLDYQEESDGGRLFHPVTISCCRVLMMPAIDELLAELKTIVKEPT